MRQDPEERAIAANQGIYNVYSKNFGSESNAKPDEPTENPFEGSGFKTKKDYKKFMSVLKKKDKVIGKGYKVSHSITKWK